jgi:hypothetical protein
VVLLLTIQRNCGFASHDTKSVPLDKYGVAEEVALIRNPGSGVKACTSPIDHRERSVRGHTRRGANGTKLGGLAKSVMEGPVNGKEELDSFADRSDILTLDAKISQTRYVLR